MRIREAFFGIALFVSGAPAIAQFSPIPLTIRETAGVSRRLDPVTTGVPIPREADLRDTNRLRLVAAGGGEVDAQFRVLSRWPVPAGVDPAPIRWLLVDFQATVSANGVARFQLRDDGPQGDVARPLAVRETPEGVVVSTGVATFRVARDRFNLFDGVGIDPDGNGNVTEEIVPPNGNGGVVLERTDGSFYRSTDDAAPTAVRVEEEGPLRTVVRVDGRLRTQTQNNAYAGALDFLEYTARYHFYRGQRNVRLEFTLRNPDRSKAVDYHTGGAEVFHSFEDVSLRLPLSIAQGTRFLAVGDDAARGSLADGQSVLLYQDSSGGPNWGPSSDGSPYWATTFQGYRVTLGEQPNAPVLDSGLRALGVGDLSDGTAGAAVSMRSFWQNFPKGIRLDSSGRIDVQLFPRSWATPHRFRGGIQKTHDLLFQFHSGDAQDADVESVARAFAAPMRALGPPALYRDSKALGFVSVEDPSRFRMYDEAIAGVLDYQGGRPDTQGDIYRELEDKDEYGWLNWGDHYREGSKNLRYWGNNEFDFSWVMLLGYLRGADHDDRFFQRGEAMARHLIDIDLYHTDRDIFWANRGLKKHDASGVTDHNRDPNLSHFWLDGLVLYYWLTGDEGARDALEELGQWLQNREEDPVGRPGNLAYCGEVRSKGWVLQALVGLFECLGDRRYFELAKRVIPAEIALVTTSEGWIANSIGTVDPWMHGYVTEALGRYLLVARDLADGDDAIRDLLIRILEFQATMAWSDEHGMMAYTWDPSTHQPISFSSNLSQTAVNGFSYAFILTGGARYLHWAQRCYESYYRYRGYPYYYSITLSTPAKNMGFRLRFGQVFMSLRQTLSLDDEPPVIRHARAEEVRYRAAVVRFVTDERANAVVTYWPQGSNVTQVESQAQYYREPHVVPLEGLSPGTTYRFRIESTDMAGNEAEPVLGTFRTLDPDTTPPAITDFEFIGATQGMARVRFETDEGSTGRVEYGTTPDYGLSVEDHTGVRRHHEIDFPVSADTLYHFCVSATDPWGNVATSEDMTFRSGMVAEVPVAFDGHLVANYGGSRVATQGVIEVRDNARLHYDGLLWFDLRAIPEGATVIEATLEITKKSSATDSPVVTIRGVLHNENSRQARIPGIGFDPADPRYQYRDLSAQVAWAPAGGGADAAMAPIASQFQVLRFENRTYEVELTNLVSMWVSGVMPNEGLFLEVHGTGCMVQFYSSEEPDPAKRPRLRITYRR